MNDITIQQTETLRLRVRCKVEDNLGAETAQLFAYSEALDYTITSDLAEFGEEQNGYTYADVSIDETEVPSEYVYYVQVIYDDGSVDIFPNDNCNSEGCDYPTLTICALPGGESS